MKLKIKQLAAISTLAFIGTGVGHASIVTASSAGGSEAVASFVNGNGDSVSLDLGEQLAGIAAGDTYTLPATVLNFITAAGGAANVTFGIISGDTTTRTYLTSAASATFNEDVQVANSAKSLWGSTVNGLVQNLNTGDATATSTNLAYGPFAAGSGSSNYKDGGYDVWQSGDFAFSNLTAGDTTLYLYQVVFSTANTGFGAITSLSDGLFANLNLATSKLEIGPTAVVPAPAAVWLLGTALLPLARRVYKKSRATA